MPRRLSGGAGGAAVKARAVAVVEGSTGIVAALSTGLKAPLTVSRDSGSASITFAASGNRIAASIAAALAVGSSLSAIAKAVQADGAGVLVPVTLTGVAAPAPTPTPTPTPAPTAITAMLMGQSEMEYLVNTGSSYRAITQPTPGNGNLVVYTQNGVDAPPVKTTVNATTVANGEVNPAMAAMSAFLAFARPGVQFVLGDGCVPGTARFELADASTDGTDTRKFSDFTSVISAIEADYGDVGHLIECWYNADAAYIPTFKPNFWPFYFGANADGSTFALGGTVNSRPVNHCLWDKDAAPTAKGRGALKKTAKWHVLTPMPFLDSPVSPTPEMANFSADADRLSEPARAVMIGLAGDALAQSVNIKVGPSAHVCRFGGASTDIHPDTANRDGQVLLMWPIAIAMLRASGMTVNEPTVVGTEGPSDGSYCDLVVDLPNGGNLTTLAALRGTTYSGTSPHQQAVTGIEVGRSGGTRRPVFRTTETSYPQSARGTVTIVDTGSGSPRRGRVRITPETPFAFGDVISYLRGQATASLQEPRDYDLYPWFLIEHVPSLYDATALYPMEGIAVRPFQEDVAVQVPAPPFAARGAYFDGADYYSSSAATVPAGNQLLFSAWFKSDDTTWNATARRLAQFRVGTTIVMEILTASGGRFTIRVNNDTATDTVSVYGGAGTTPFAVGQWYHLMISAIGGVLRVYVNGVERGTMSYTTLDQAGQNLTQIGIGAQTSGTGPWLGDLGHVWFSTTQSLDLSVQANREKFALAGVPVDLGGTGALPTGTAPEFYFDGAGATWSNKGTAGSVALTGALTASSTAPA